MLPCICGGAASIYSVEDEHYPEDSYKVECGSCGIGLSGNYRNSELLELLWNQLQHNLRRRFLDYDD